MNRKFYDLLAEGGGGEEQQEQLLEGLDAEGNVLEGYQRLDDGTIAKVEDPAEKPAEGESSEEAPAEENPEDFFKEVENITGKQYTIDYGGVDPTTPAGIAIRDEVIEKSTIEEWEKNLKENYPDAYAYLLHRSMGGSKEEFFTADSTPTIPTREELESSSDIQASIVRTALASNDIPEDVIKATIDSYIKNNTLKTKAEELYNKFESAQTEQIARLQRAQEEQDAQFQRETRTALETIESSINSDALGIVIPTAKKPEFSNFVKEKLRYSDGSFYFVQPLEKDKLSSTLSSLYLQFVGNDLSKMIRKEAGIKTVQKLRTTIAKAAAAEKNGTEKPEVKEDFIPLSAFMPKQRQ